MKAIPGWGNLYKVSRQGAVYSVRAKRFLKTGFNPVSSYPVVALCRNGKPATFYVHRLVLLTYKGPCPEGKEACHNNGIRRDNRLSNLRYDSRSNNGKDRIRHGTATPKGVKNKLCILSERDLKWASNELKKGVYSLRALAVFLEVTHGTLSRQIKNLKRGEKCLKL